MTIKFLLIILLLIILWSWLLEPNLLTIKKIKLKNSQLKGKKIVFISDLHIKPHERHRICKIVKKINNLNPDIVLFGGDYVNGHKKGYSMSIEDIAFELSKIKSPKIGIIGNHDGWQGKNEIKSALEKHFIKILINDNVKVDNLCIIGLDDIQTGDPDIKKAFQKSQSPRILLTHSPDVFPLVTEEITLALAGHTHGGQIVFPFNIPIIVPSKYGKKYAKGLICENNKKIFITKGLGTSILPLRFCCIPEIVLIDFCDN